MSAVAARRRPRRRLPRSSRRAARRARSPGTQELGAWAVDPGGRDDACRLTDRARASSKVQALLTRTLRDDRQPPDPHERAAAARGGRPAGAAAVPGAGRRRAGGRRRLGAVAQGGLFFATKTLKPKWSRLNPLQGAKRMFGPHALWEGAKMLLKSALVGVLRVARGRRADAAARRAGPAAGARCELAGSRGHRADARRRARRPASRPARTTPCSAGAPASRSG